VVPALAPALAELDPALMDVVPAPPAGVLAPDEPPEDVVFPAVPSLLLLTEAPPEPELVPPEALLLPPWTFVLVAPALPPEPCDPAAPLALAPAWLVPPVVPVLFPPSWEHANAVVRRMPAEMVAKREKTTFIGDRIRCSWCLNRGLSYRSEMRPTISML
jgi:hypothetical protein